MRIIAGEFRGRRLLGPQGTETRPITDRVKQSLFDILTPLLENSLVYDCFAGTGSLGLEALSRGAAHVTFFECQRSALTRLRNNIETLGVQQRCVVVPGDIFKWIQANEAQRKQDLVFLDPPYRFLVQRAEELKKLARRIAEAHLKRGGTVVFRHDARDQLELAPLSTYEKRSYGSMVVELAAAR